MFQVGDWVRLTDGVLPGLEGVIITPEEAVRYIPGALISSEVRAGEAFWVLLRIFNQPVPVEMRAASLQAALDCRAQ